MHDDIELMNHASIVTPQTLEESYDVDDDVDAADAGTCRSGTAPDASMRASGKAASKCWTWGIYIHGGLECGMVIIIVSVCGAVLFYCFFCWFGVVARVIAWGSYYNKWNKSSSCEQHYLSLRA